MLSVTCTFRPALKTSLIITRAEKKGLVRTGLVSHLYKRVPVKAIVYLVDCMLKESVT